jgi:hypothetical protein
MAGKIGRNIPAHIYRALLTRSGNKCAYPGCPNPIVNSKNIYEANLCHIESVSHKEQRYNPHLTKEQLNSYDNLMFMCTKHHVETNDENIFTVDILKEMKYKHESHFIENPFQIDMSHVYLLKKEIEEFWNKVEYVNENEHVFPDLKVSINTKADFLDLCDEIEKTINSIESLIEIIDKNDQNKYWEIFNLGFPNHLNIIRIALEQITIKYLETYLVSNPHNMQLKAKLENLRKVFLEISKTSTHAD